MYTKRNYGKHVSSSQEVKTQTNDENDTQHFTLPIK